MSLVGPDAEAAKAVTQEMQNTASPQNTPQDQDAQVNAALSEVTRDDAYIVGRNFDPKGMGKFGPVNAATVGRDQIDAALALQNPNLSAKDREQLVDAQMQLNDDLLAHKSQKPEKGNNRTSQEQALLTSTIDTMLGATQVANFKKIFEMQDIETSAFSSVPLVGFLGKTLEPRTPAELEAQGYSKQPIKQIQDTINIANAIQQSQARSVDVGIARSLTNKA